jgi:ribosomal protein L31
MAKQGIHPTMYKDVEVVCICGAKHIIGSATVPGPIKVESCPNCHPAYNPDRKVEVVIKGQRQKYLERLEKMKKLQQQRKSA